MKKFNIAVVGATGLVGRKMLEILYEKNVPIGEIFLFASESSEGVTVNFGEKRFVVKTLCEKNILNKKIDFALFSAGGEISKKYAPMFVKIGATVIDNSSAWRMEKGIDLVVPQINEIKNFTIIANPNCSTIQSVLPIFCVKKLYDISKIDYVSFQAVSGSGMKGILDLERTSLNLEARFYPYPIFNNCLPHIGKFLDNDFSEEELKMINETKKILELPDVEISATCVRVPVKHCHAVSISVTCCQEIDIEVVKQSMRDCEEIVLFDNPSQSNYPTQTMAFGKDEIFVGRLRKDLFNPKRLHFWCVADNIRKGAATNAVEILLSIIKNS